MKVKSLIILMLTLFACFTSCKKAPLTVGKIVTEYRELPDFNEVQLNDNINLSLVRSDTSYIEITTGENIIGNITTEIKGSSLILCNTSTLNWMRPYDFELHATLYFKDIKNIVFASSGTLDTPNQFNDTIGSYSIEIDYGSGDIDILLNKCRSFSVLYYHGTSQINLHGRENNYLNIYTRSYGVVNARNCETRYVDVAQSAVGDCYIWSYQKIQAEITNLADIYYKGEPTSISVTYGEDARGRLIPLN